MTEEIIIDGVNVAGCMDYKEVEYKEMPICMNYYNHLPKPPKETEWQYCAGNKNCYYKQLKRLEIEIEKLKGVDGSVHPDSAYYKITRLEQEDKELKEKNATLEDKLQLKMASDKESDAFWDEIFSEKDYPFNKENAYKELRDYYFVLEQLPKIYMEITGGTLSKTTYFASSVVEAYNDSLNRYYEKIDDLEYDNNAYRSALEEIREDMEQDTTCESRECGCDDYAECLNCIKETILNKINEVLNDK